LARYEESGVSELVERLLLEEMVRLRENAVLFELVGRVPVALRAPFQLTVCPDGCAEESSNMLKPNLRKVMQAGPVLGWQGGLQAGKRQSSTLPSSRLELRCLCAET